MRKFLALVLLFTVASCGTKKKTTYSTSKSRTVSVNATSTERRSARPTVASRKAEKTSNSKVDNIINTALQYSGVRYKFGGTTKKGMDCSGLLYVAFGEHDVQLPRVSRNMAEEGRRVRVKDVEKGDLLFFSTQKRGRGINHVGMVVAIEDDEIKFIHSSSSRGVIVSSLREGYWNYAFVKATRVL
ncbi:NlpC/P60 family protein [Aggregatimonas sangjinii]|uniref:NlpC/P60 family protein n=1 Tax=Aggregatimonas sangjinii TaxID=2583587 RepID=A0A5B7SQ15_9FLAO|nr:C40 family peptidase [Aggregatimonas sangjinii]QCW98723.1 NlpC/P60 family protein [Aggregatimonas sangjinii]